MNSEALFESAWASPLGAISSSIHSTTRDKMNQYIAEFLKSEYFNNPDFIEGVQVGLGFAKAIADGAKLGLGEREEFQEFTAFVENHRRDLPI